MNEYATDQENFWAGDFGNDYIDRNRGPRLIAANLALLSCALRNTKGIRSCIEFSANVGNNLAALKLLFPEIELHGIEINHKMVKNSFE